MQNKIVQKLATLEQIYYEGKEKCCMATLFTQNHLRYGSLALLVSSSVYSLGKSLILILLQMHHVLTFYLKSQISLFYLIKLWWFRILNNSCKNSAIYQLIRKNWSQLQIFHKLRMALVTQILTIFLGLVLNCKKSLIKTFAKGEFEFSILDKTAS